MERLIESVLSTQRQLQGLLSGRILDLFTSVDNFAVGMAVAVALGLVHALTPGHGRRHDYPQDDGRLYRDQANELMRAVDAGSAGKKSSNII